MQAGILLGLEASANAMSLRRPSDPNVPVVVCIKCECKKKIFLDTTYGGITQDEITDLRQRLHSHCQYAKVHRGNPVPWETVRTWPVTCYTKDYDTEYAMPNLQIMRARLRHRSCGATLRRSRSPRRDPVFRDPQFCIVMLVENLSAMGAPITLDVEASESIDTVMAKIEETKGFPTARQRLYFQGFRLDFDKGRSLLSYTTSSKIANCSLSWKWRFS